MSFFRKLFAPKPKGKAEYPNVKHNEDPFLMWEKTGELGDGAFGKVYKAKHKEDGRLAALKIVPINNDEEMEDFVVEIDILSECKHKNIVGLYEAFLWDSKLHIFIEFCAGGAVDDIIVELDHGLSETQIKCIAKQMFEGLTYLHSSKCIHRDLKAGNVLLCPNGTIRLADFGVSAKNKKTLQKRETYIGTPYWMAPEVIACETCKDVPYDYSADIWSAGITLIEMAEMNPPHHEMSPMRVIMKITKADAPSLCEPSKWSPEFCDLIKQCLQKNPARRPTATAVLEHPFFQSTEGTKPLRILYLERRAEVVEKLEELPEFQDKEDSDQDSLHSPSDVGPAVSAVPSTSSSVSSAIGPDISVVADHTDGAVRQEKSNGAVVGKASPGKKRSGSVNKDYHFQTLSRVRTFEVDGQVFSTTTTHIVDTKKNFTISDSRKYKLMRKQDLRELKVLQREEQKEAQVLQEKIRQDQELMEKRFELQREDLEKRFEVRLDSMKKAQKRDIEKLESSQEAYFKSKTKKLKQEQSKELKRFKEELKQEEKLVTSETKLEVDAKSLPKVERKKQLTKRLSDLYVTHVDKDKQFQQAQSDAFNNECRRLQKEKRENVHQMEKQFLIDQQNLIRARESELWEMEQQQIQEKHQLFKHQLKEAFFMHRHQMHMKHKKEVEQHQRIDSLKMEALRQKHILEGRRLPKQLKQEFKNQFSELRKQLRMQKDPDEKEKLKDLESQNSRRLEYELRQLQEKHVREEETLKTEQQSEMKELETIQSEKKQMLIQQENQKMKERDDQYTQQLKDWRVQISQRKKELEEEFTGQRRNLHDYFKNEVTSAELPSGPTLHPRTASHSNVVNRYSMDPSVLDVLNSTPVS